MIQWNDSERRKEVLRYLRYRGGEIETETITMLDEAIASLREKTRPADISQRYRLEKTGSGIALSGTGLVLPGKHIAKHLTDCGQAVVLAATLGAEADRLIHAQFLRDAARAVILDAAANQYIEEVCDDASRSIKQEAAQDGFAVTSRFSPGYGDLPLTIQPSLLLLLNAERRIGLTVTANLMLVPRKSVTAIIGLSHT